MIHAPRELCFEVVASAGKLVERRSDTERVVEFTTARGGSEVRTLELLLLEKPNVIRYEWLEGPLDNVREAIFFDEVDERTTRLRYEGEFSLRNGIAGAVIGRIKVRPIFDRLVREHLAEAKSIAERRASRSRVYPRPASDPGPDSTKRSG